MVPNTNIVGSMKLLLNELAILIYYKNRINFQAIEDVVLESIIAIFYMPVHVGRMDRVHI